MINQKLNTNIVEYVECLSEHPYLNRIYHSVATSISYINYTLKPSIYFTIIVNFKEKPGEKLSFDNCVALCESYCDASPLVGDAVS